MPIFRSLPVRLISLVPALFTLLAGLGAKVWAADPALPVAGAAQPQLAASAAKRQPVINQKGLTKPDWQELSETQKKALAPLAANWASITEGQKRKWLAVSQNFGSMPPADQKLLHTRMAEWVSLSSQQRSQARLNFAGVRELPADERLAKWQAYQALSPEERQRLAAAAAQKPSGAATAIKPVASHKLIKPPTTTAAKEGDDKGRSARPLPKIVTDPDIVDPQTLLPQQAQGPDSSTTRQ